jgi:hypothetical protein
MFINEDVFINNAGLVLLYGYYFQLFERLGFTENHTFKNEEFRLQAVHFLQYLATGMEQTEASYLVFNKVLCGIPVRTSVPEGITISEEQKELIEGLIMAAISHWPGIENCSIDGFRGSWLMREGIIYETPDDFVLTVERRSYDLLMNKAPFSYSLIKLPWMLKPLRVNWPY